jgi:hypothetical protein
LILATTALAVITATVRAEDPLPASGGTGGLRAIWNALKSADGSSDAISISSQTYNGYKRTRLPDGTFKPETYAFAEGGYGGGTVAGQPADRVPFLRIAHTIAGPLAGQAYVPTRDMGKTDLMILVFWGVTGVDTSPDNGYGANIGPGIVSTPPPLGGPGGGGSPTESPGSDQWGNGTDSMIAFENYWRDRTNFRNARILGYAKEFTQTIDNYSLRDVHGQLVEDIEDPRYYVVLQAYDFPKARDQKRLVLLWSTRYSIRERRNDFDRDLAAMTRRASRYFGQDSHGLQRNLSFRSSVDIGTPKVIEFDPQAVREIGPPEPDKPAEKTEPPKR